MPLITQILSQGDQTLFQTFEFFFQILRREVTSSEEAIFFGDLRQVFQDVLDLATILARDGVDQIQTRFHLHEAIAIKLQTIDHIF